MNLQNVESNFNKHLAFAALYSTSGRAMTPQYLKALLALAKDSK